MAKVEIKNIKKLPLLWDREKTLQLINLLEANKCLWDTETKDYHNKSKRYSAIQRLANTLDMKEDDIRKKIHCLRTQYTNERNKMKRRKCGWNGSGEEYKTKWEYFQALQFLFQQQNMKNEFIDLENNYTVFFDESTSTQDVTDHLDDSSKKISQLREPSELSDSSHSGSSLQIFQSTSTLKPSKKRYKKAKTSTKNQGQATIERCLSVLENPKEKDQYTVFGEYIANELRNLKHEEDLQIKMKINIQKIILDINSEYAKRKF